MGFIFQQPRHTVTIICYRVLYIENVISTTLVRLSQLSRLTSMTVKNTRRSSRTDLVMPRGLFRVSGSVFECEPVE